MQQYLPFTVLKPFRVFWFLVGWTIGLQQYLPFTVLKPDNRRLIDRQVMLQQYLPFTVLKPQQSRKHIAMVFVEVATVLTVYGIETITRTQGCHLHSPVATVLTVYGIETSSGIFFSSYLELQQYLPFTVLKRFAGNITFNHAKLQQHLPFTVLKHT